MNKITQTIRELIDTKNFLKVSPDSLIRETAVKMPAHHSSSAVVIEKSMKLVGIITEQDIVQRAVGMNRNVDETIVEEIMTPDPTTISADAPTSHALHIIAEKGFRTLPVLDDHQVIGIVDIRDLYESVNCLLVEQLKSDENLISYCFGEPYATGYLDR